MKLTRIIFAALLILMGVIYVFNGSKAAATMFIVAALYAIFAALFAFASGNKLKASLSCEASGRKGEPVDIVINGSNESKIPVPSCEYEVSCRNRLTEEQQSINMECSYLPHGKHTDKFTLTGKHCGKEIIEIRNARISDPLRLFRRRSKVTADGVIYIMPDVHEVAIPDDYLDSYDMESYIYSQHKAGQDAGEVYEVREYNNEDNPKQIHWKLSAKMDDLMVRIPSYPVENKLIVILDNSLAEGTVIDADKRNDLMELFFSVSYSLIRKNIPHSLGWCDHDSGGFVIRKIDSERSIWRHAHEMLGAGIEQSTEPTIYRFIMDPGEEHFTNHFIVTCQDVIDKEKLERYGAVREFRC